MKIKLTESKLKQIVAESVKKVLSEASYVENGNFDEEISMREYEKYFEQISDALVDMINNHPTIGGISCVKKQGRQWGEYNLVIKLPLHNNFESTREDIIDGVTELVGYISNSVMCNNYKVWGAFMENLHPSLTNSNTVTADVKYIKSTRILKIMVKIPYNVMKELVDNTYPNVQICNVDFFEDNVTY